MAFLRGTTLREGLEAGRIDLALLIGPADDPRTWPVGELELTWYSAPAWRRPAAAQPVSVVAFDQPPARCGPGPWRRCRCTRSRR
ncbi:hypothetical protein FRAHR75_430046 [Frankia sp. Hr75.2]|nr:hypothetical protein FRAHR75_430046 [Frankia sp. Hr75.2]